jgi:hypothetical protein
MIRKHLRVVITDPASGATLCTGIHIDVPSGLTRQQAADYVTGVAAREIGRYAAWEALNLGPIPAGMASGFWEEKVT